MVFFLYTLVNLSINRSKRVSEVRVTVLPLASRIEKTVAGHSELCRIYLNKECDDVRRQQCPQDDFCFFVLLITLKS